MGCTHCDRISEEEQMNLFWNKLYLANQSARQLLSLVKTFKCKNQEDFFREFQRLIILPYFKGDDFKCISDYIIKNNLSLGSPFKTLLLFFCFLLVSNTTSEKVFYDIFTDFYDLCNKYMDLTNFNINDLNFIKEIIIFYVHMISEQTFKAFLMTNYSIIFETSKAEFFAFFSQKNRDDFVNNIFVYYKKNEFSLSSFLNLNLKKLRHKMVINSLKDIESRNQFNNRGDS